MTLQDRMQDMMDGRVSSSAAGEEQTVKSRKTISFYLDTMLIDRLDKAWHTLNTEGIRIERVDFRERILEIGLANIAHLRSDYEFVPDEDI